MKRVLLVPTVLAALIPGVTCAETPEGVQTGGLSASALNTLEANGYGHIGAVSMRGGLVYAPIRGQTPRRFTIGRPLEELTARARNWGHS